MTTAYYRPQGNAVVDHSMLAIEVQEFCEDKRVFWLEKTQNEGKGTGMAKGFFWDFIQLFNLANTTGSFTLHSRCLFVCIYSTHLI